MAQEVPVAGLAGPVSVGDRGVGTALGELAGGVRQLQQNRLQNQVKGAAEEAAALADRNRQQLESGAGQFQSGLDTVESGQLLSTAEGQTAEGLLASQGRDIGKRANRVFGRYRTALAQGATNATAARIAVEKEMQSMISMNPAFADVIRAEAANAMGQTEFNLLIRDREKIPAGSQTTSQYSKDKANLTDAVNDMAALQGWSDSYKQARMAQMTQDLAEKYSIENSNTWFDANQSFDENDAIVKSANIGKEISLKSSEILGNGLDLIASNGGLADDGTIPHIGEEQVAQLTTNIQGQIQKYRLQLEETLPRTIDPEERQRQINAHLKPLVDVETSLRSQSASNVLDLMYKAQNLGMKVSMAKAFPLYTAIHETYGENAQYFLKLFDTSKMSELAFQNSTLIPENLKQMVARGTIKREDVPAELTAYLRENIDAALQGGETNWEFVNSAYLGPAAAAVPKEARDKDTQYEQALGAASVQKPLEVAKTIAGTPNVDKHQQAVVGTWTTAVNGLAQQAKADLERDNRDRENRQSYIAATVNPDGKLSLLKYTAIAGTDENGNHVWRVNGGVPVRGLSSGLNNLTTRYGIGGGNSRSVVEHPAFADKFYGQTSEEYVVDLINNVNGQSGEPAWLPAIAQRGTGQPTIAQKPQPVVNEEGQEQPAEPEQTTDTRSVLESFGSILSYGPLGGAATVVEAIGNLFSGGDEPQQQENTVQVTAERGQLEVDEGTKKNSSGQHISYNDTEGYLTGGIGHLMTEEEKALYPEGTVIPEDVVNKWFEEDLQEAVDDADDFLGDGEYPDEVKQIVTNMAFNLGPNRLKKFKKFKKALADGDWDAAADEMVDSKWYGQVKDRSKRLVARMRAVE